ncbi:Niemann-Pick type C-related protein [Elsinoe australis]|uniref:Niemann-Pick type C-related protein n=1 Tax=Elsinoe australis TaxID=40998 RepID=A0A4U7BAG8_9PEZI|nr:Niemann-Pick type C-related protein [Elsinoe australis]
MIPRSIGGALALLLAGSPLASAVAPSTPDWTTKHEAGRCAIRGNCGKQSFFGSELPCPDNGLAEEPEAGVRDRLVKICGEKWSDGKVCCKAEQLEALESNLKRAEGIISACPACKTNFFDLFCTFTCSPNQSLFVNVTKAEPKGDKFLTTELDHLVSDKNGAMFYDSCKDVKLGATGGRAMTLIGGDAKNYTQFLKFLGDKKPFGSPFQIDFPRPNEEDFPGMKPNTEEPHPCNSKDERYRCACVDCDASCPALPAVEDDSQCYVGLLPCLSFAIILIYSVFIILLVLLVSGHIAYRRHNQSKNERLRLLQDSTPSDDEDEGDIVQHAGLIDRPTKGYWLNTWCDLAFSKLGRTSARYPAITTGTSILVVLLLSLGWMNFQLETDPVRLWVAPNSAAAQEKAYFDKNFGPFFRTEQAFLVNDTSPSSSGTVLSYETLQWWFDVEYRIQRMKSYDGGHTLKDVCYKPTGGPCVVQSITGYFDGPRGGVDRDSWKDTLEQCVGNFGDYECLPEFQQPIDPKYIFGPFNQSVFETEALITTWVVSNADEGTDELKRAMDWEASLKDMFLMIKGEARERGLRLSFTTESSLEEELNKSTNTDAKIVAISYVIMFLYASLALGSTTLTIRTLLRDPTAALVQSKFMLGVVGIVIVLMSVSASVGLFAAAGVKATLIIAEVIPFLVLAVGVDNIFLIVHEFERVNVSNADDSIEERMSRALGRMGPSILLSASTETVAFALGAAVGMPAVRNFAAYAAGAVFINFVLQVTMFISVLAWNQRRVEAGRADCIPCIRVSTNEHMGTHDRLSAFYGAEEEGGLQRFIRKTYAPAILKFRSKVVIITIFLGIFTAGLALLPSIQLGLDQRIAIPSDSYLIKYFDDLYDYFNAGPPVYFVTRPLNVTERQHQQDLCGRFSTCSEFSLANVLEQERKRPEVSYIADATASWIDDYFTWLNPSLTCCLDGSTACFENRDPPWNVTLYGMPEGQEFIHYLNRWIRSPTDEDCPLGGKAPYSNALVIDNSSLTIPASHFRTAHTALHSQDDFISAYKAARRVADDISERNNIDVFPYSKFYIFFDQYVSIVRLSTALIGGALAFVAFISSLLLGSIATGLVVTLTVGMTLIAILGTMALCSVSLNAVSLVNLIICVGISVEFCAHIARAFSVPSQAILDKTRLRGRDARSFAALVNVGGSVISGIGITKVLGVAVLAFTRSKIFEVYYFRVWAALVVWAALHALVLLPVLLSIVGGRGYLDPESDGGLEQDLAARRYRALIPDEEYDSDEY